MKYYMLLMVLVLAVALTGCAGAKGEKGADGAIGPIGNTGEPGLTGPKGNDGTVITIVQLCPGYTTYSNTFVEVGECINNKLYGVYSANGGFFTELPPGEYTSNGIGSACNLTVGANCTVTPH